MRPAKLTGQAHADAVTLLTQAGWAHDAQRDAVAKDFKFKDFSAAFAWMTRAAMEAERLDHHPEWRNVYSRVHAVLTTHDVQGLTVLDVQLAQAMDRFAG